jgi:hypothetical protein
MAPGWNHLILSSGETSLAEYVRSARRQVFPGQEVRLCDLDVDAGVGLGLFDHIHGFVNSSAFARHLVESARRCHGAPIRPFLRMLVKDRIVQNSRQSPCATSLWSGTFLTKAPDKCGARHRDLV